MRSATAIKLKRAAALAAGLLVFTLAADSAHAHFLWLTVRRDNPKAPVVEAFLSETPTPDLPEFLKRIEHAEISAGGRRLEPTKGEEAYEAELPVPPPTAVDGFCDLGVMTRKNATFRLIYTARVQLGPWAASRPAEPSDHLRLRLVARGGRAPALAVTFRGEPAPEAVVKAFPDEGEPVELKAGADGRLEVPGLAEGRTGVLAKWVEKRPGSLGGKAYEEVRYYATLTAAPASRETAAAAPQTESFARLVEPVNSFGGAVLDGWLYVYSGHLERTHTYHDKAVSRGFRRLDLKDRTRWEELPAGPPLQGVTLAAHGGKLYRVGGMAAKNRPGEPNDLVSSADFACFDPVTRAWTNLAPLPEPRSTHDAVVIGDQLYVVGGWNLPGGDAALGEFHHDALAFDLSRPDGGWETLAAPPFRRRALAAASLGGKLVVLGGLTEDGKVVKTVDVYDPARRAWSRGPDLPGSRLEGFAPSAFEVAGRLYVSGRDGVVRRLNDSADGWEEAGKLAVPRLTHRLLPGIAGDVLVVGGNSGGRPVGLIESIVVDGRGRAAGR